MQHTAPHPHPVVGMIGRKRSGKDSFASVLVEEFGFTKVAFADPLREAALDLDPIVHVQTVDQPDYPGCDPELVVARLSEIVRDFGWEKAKDGYPEVRRILQYLGTEVVRKREPDFWIRRAEETIRKINGPVVVTDVRFENEAELVKALGGHTVRVLRSGFASDDPHPSEVALDHYAEDHTVLNRSTVAELHDVARRVADHLLP